jgi:hypothetical protein
MCIIGVGVQLHIFLTSELDGGERSTSHYSCFMPGKEPQYPLNWRLGGPWSWSGQLEKRKISYSAKIQTTDHAACILATTQTQLSNIMVISNLYSSQTFKKCTGMTLTSGSGCVTVSCTELMFVLKYRDINKLIAENGELTLLSCK